MNKIKTAFITGAANGIGAETARLLVSKGVRVFITDTDEAGLAVLEKELGDMAIAMRHDVQREEDWSAALDTAFSAFGAIDVVISNAGKLNPGFILDTDAEKLREHFDINVMGVLHGLKCAFPRFKAQGHGRIVNIASVASFVPVKGQVAYCASKHAVRAIHYGFAQENSGQGIEFSIVHPGAVDTGMIQQMIGNPAGALAFAEPSVSASEVAAAIWAAIANNKKEVMVPSGNFLLRFVGVLPAILGRAVRSAEKRGLKRMAALTK